MFNVGDKVIVKNNCEYWGFDGKMGVVTDINTSDYPIHVVLIDKPGHPYLFALNELELVNNG